MKSILAVLLMPCLLKLSRGKSIPMVEERSNVQWNELDDNKGKLAEEEDFPAKEEDDEGQKMMKLIENLTYINQGNIRVDGSSMKKKGPQNEGGPLKMPDRPQLSKEKLEHTKQVVERCRKQSPSQNGRDLAACLMSWLRPVADPSIA